MTTVVSSMVTRNQTSLTKVGLHKVEELQFLPQEGFLLNNSALQSLEIFYCHKFEGFVISKEDSPHHFVSSTSNNNNNNNSNNSSLEYLELSECPVLTFLPDLRCCTSLRVLTIQGCTALTKSSLPDEADFKKWVEQQQQQQQQFQSTTTISSFHHLEKLEISNCPRLKVAPTFFPSLKDLSVRRIKDMIGMSMVTTRNYLTFLIRIDISELEELQFLPQGLLLNSSNTLQRLSIDHCSKFEGFVISKEDSLSPVLGSNNTCSLKSLCLFGCPVLKFLPDLCYFTSLQNLTIEDCKELMKSLPHEDELKKCLPSLRFLDVK